MEDKVRLKGQLRIYMQWPLILSVIWIVCNLVMGMVNRWSGIAMCSFTVLYVLLALWLYFYHRKRLLGGLVEFAAEFSNVHKQMLTEIDLPYALSDEDGHILWTNARFNETVGVEKGHKKNLIAIFPELTKELLAGYQENNSIHVSDGDIHYRLDRKPVSFKLEGLQGQLTLGNDLDGQKLLAIYLYDETSVLKYKKEIDDQKMVSGLIYLDNYDEALESVEEVRRSLLTALIDRKINKYITGMNGILKKLEKDKYFFAIKQQYIEEIKNSRFSILEDVKTVNIGNEMSVTLSIGIGTNGDTYSQNYDFSRVAIDMALGRGGDQAVIKDGEKIQYFGGKSQQQEKTTRVKARVKAHALRELLESKDRILIMGHKMSDIDSFGAGIGIYRIATSLNKKAHVIINEITSSVRPMKDRFVGNSDYPEDLFLTGEQAADLVDGNTVLIVVDVNRPSITDAPELLGLVKTIVVLDHHRQSSEIIDNAVLSYVEPYASSACEMVAEILQYIADGIRIRACEADAMYAGIVIDTNNFLNQTGVRTFEAAAFLRRNGADVTRVRKMFRDEMIDYKARAEAVRRAEIYKGAFSISVCPAEGLESPTIVGAQAANELLDIVGIKASIVFTEYNGVIYASARSIDEVNVQVMMEQLGGGGHRTTAGAQLKGMTLEQARERLQQVIDQMLEEGDIL